MSSEIKLRNVTTPGYSYTLRWRLLHKQISKHEIEQGKMMEEPWQLWNFGKFHYFVHSILFVIMFIPFTHPSPNSIPPCVSCVQTSLCFMFPFYFAFSFPLFYFPIPEPWPWYMPNPRYPDMPSPNINTFWTSCMFPSLKSTLIVSRTHHLNLQTLSWNLRTVGIWWHST